MRPIDADALLEQIGIDSDGSPGYYGDTWQFIKTIENAPTLDMTSEWIPCEEMLPKESEQDSELGVLVTLGNGYNGIQFDWVRDGEHWYDWDGYVIAWMPLESQRYQKTERHARTAGSNILPIN